MQTSRGSGRKWAVSGALVVTTLALALMARVAAAT